MIELLKQMVEALERASKIMDADAQQFQDNAIKVGKQALAELESQEPVAWGVFEGNLHDMFFTQEEAQEMAKLKGSHAEAKPLYTHPPQRTEVNNK